jgi:hypothetical protein
LAIELDGGPVEDGSTWLKGRRIGPIKNEVGENRWLGEADPKKGTHVAAVVGEWKGLAH